MKAATRPTRSPCNCTPAWTLRVTQAAAPIVRSASSAGASQAKANSQSLVGRVGHCAERPSTTPVQPACSSRKARVTAANSGEPKML